MPRTLECRERALNGPLALGFDAGTSPHQECPGPFAKKIEGFAPFEWLYRRTRLRAWGNRRVTAFSRTQALKLHRLSRSRRGRRSDLLQPYPERPPGDALNTNSEVETADFMARRSGNVVRINSRPTNDTGKGCGRAKTSASSVEALLLSRIPD